MNFEAGRLINVDVAGLGASPQTLEAKEEPVLITNASVTGGSLQLIVSNDGFSADNRKICDITGTDTVVDWPLFWMAKGEEVKFTFTGTKAFVRTRGKLE